MFRVFEGPTADTVWRNIARAFVEGECLAHQRSRAGMTAEVLHAAISLENPKERWVTSRQPTLNVAFALAEVIWILRGRNDSAFLNYFNRQLPKYAGQGVCYHGAYGFRLRRSFHVDQLERAYQALLSNPDSRQVVLQIWSPLDDLPNPKGDAAATDIPCNITSILKVRNGGLEWLQVLRSNDLYRGLPYNLVQFTTLQEVLAGWLGTNLGPYHQVSDSLHVYDDAADFIKQSIASNFPNASNLDSLALPKEASEHAFQTLEELVEGIVAEQTPVEELVNWALETTLPAGFGNIARVLCAEGARRRRRADLAERIMEACTNPVFVLLYQGWLARRREKA
jgi:thymidylate synthase